MQLHQAGQGDQRRQGDVRRRVGDHLRAGRGGALPMARRERRGRVPPRRHGQRPDGDLAQRQPRLHQRRPLGRPLRPGDGRQHRRPSDLRCRRARGLRSRSRAAPRRPLAHLPAFDDRTRRRGRVPHCGHPAGGIGRLHATPPHRRGHHRIRRRGIDRPHGARARAPARRHRPPRFPPGPAQGGRRARARPEISGPVPSRRETGRGHSRGGARRPGRGGRSAGRSANTSWLSTAHGIRISKTWNIPSNSCASVGTPAARRQST